WSRYRQRGELQIETLTQIASTHTGGFEVLQVLERDLQLFRLHAKLFGQHLLDLSEILRKVAVFIERFDQQRHQRAVTLGELGERKLHDQMVAQRRTVGSNLRIVVLVAVFASA